MDNKYRKDFRDKIKAPKVKDNDNFSNWKFDNPYKLGLEYFKKNNFELAIRSFEDAIEKEPDNPLIRYNLAICYININNYNNAVIHLRRGISKNNTDNYNFYIQLAECYIKQERFEQALNELDNALKIKETKNIRQKISDIYCKKADDLKQEENYKEAIINYLKAINMIPDNEISLFEIAEAYHKINELSKALNYYQKALPFIKNKKRLSDTYRYIAEINISLGNEEVVIEFSKKVLKLDPYNAISNFYLGEVYFKKGKYDEALKKYLDSLKGDSNFIASYMAIGQVYVMKGLNENAINYYSKVLSIDKYNSPALCNIGIIRYKQGNIPLAIELIKKSSLDGKSKNYLTYKYLGIIFLNINNYLLAIENFKIAIEINNEEIENNINLGFCFQKIGNLELAIEEYNKVLEIEPNNIQALKNLGGIYYDIFQIQEALEIYSKLQDLDKNNLIYKKYIANCFRRLGYYEEAIDYYDKYLEKYPNDFEARLFIGISYYETGELEISFKIFYELVTVFKSEISNSFLYLSKIYEKMDQLEEAYTSAKESALANTKNYRAFLQYAKISLKVNKIDKAYTCLKKVLELKPDNREAIELMNNFDKI